MSFPGDVTSTNGSQVSNSIVEWKLRPGVVSTMNAQARYTDPSARSFTTAAIWLIVGALLVAGVIGGLAWMSRDTSRNRATRSPVPTDPHREPPSTLLCRSRLVQNRWHALR